LNFLCFLGLDSFFNFSNSCIDNIITVGLDLRTITLIPSFIVWLMISLVLLRKYVAEICWDVSNFMLTVY
jgi:hypothetical protein